MMTFFAFIIYNFFALPLIYISVHIGAVFSKKLRHGVWVRHFQWRRVKLHENEKCLLFHTASLGEYEHIRPLFPRLRKNCAKPKFIVNMFFSPSGYLNANTADGPDQYIYAPFDTPWAVARLYRRLKPAALVIAKHDIWPNQVWMAKLMNIRIILINASLGSKSSRLQWWSKGIHRIIYKYVDAIFTISQQDRDNFSILVDQQKLHVSGDTKFDQVINRMEEAAEINLLPLSFWKGQMVFVAGSVWPADIDVIRNGVIETLEQRSDFRLVLVPHDPSEKHLKSLENAFPSTIRFSQIDHYSGEKVILVDRVGILATIYKYAKIAFVGGGFKEGIHNVMEAAVYKIPVIYGPNISGSSEAMDMAREKRGGMVVNNESEFSRSLTELMTNPVRLKEKGEEAYNFVLSRVGASDKITRVICELI